MTFPLILTRVHTGTRAHTPRPLLRLLLLKNRLEQQTNLSSLSHLLLNLHPPSPAFSTLLHGPKDAHHGLLSSLHTTESVLLDLAHVTLHQVYWSSWCTPNISTPPFLSTHVPPHPLTFCVQLKKFSAASSYAPQQKSLSLLHLPPSTVMSSGMLPNPQQ